MALLNLPTELLQLIFCYVDDDALDNLSFVSRRLHDIALHLYLARLHEAIDSRTIHPRVVARIKRSRNCNRVIPILRRSLFINSAQELQCRLSFGTDRRLLGQLRGLVRLAERLSQLKTVKIWIRNVVPVSGEYAWTLALMELLTTITEKPCTTFRVSGSSESDPLLEIDIAGLRPPEPSTSPAPATSSDSETSSLAWSRAAAGKRCAAGPPGVVRAFKRFKKCFSTSRKARAIPSSATDDVKQARKVVERGNDLPPITTLRRFELDSSYFLRPALLPWTIRTMDQSSRSIVTLELGQLSLSPRSWTNLLEFLSLPSLIRLSITSSRISVADLWSFLKRHSTIQRMSLKLDREVTPTVPFGAAEQETEVDLPCLKRMNITSFSMKRLLDTNRLTAPSLNYVTIQRSEMYAGIDDALHSLGRNFDPSSRIALTLEVTGESAWAHWLRPESPTRVERLLHCVTKLTLVVPSGASTLHHAIDLPQWLALFPALKQVLFIGHGAPFLPLVERAPDRKLWRFTQRLHEKCPRMEYVQIDSKWYRLRHLSTSPKKSATKKVKTSLRHSDFGP